MKKKLPKNIPTTRIEDKALRATNWIGSGQSLILHTLIFIVAFMLPFVGISLERVLLILTTAVSLEAIYLAIFIQMSVNKNTEDIEEIQDDLEEIEEGVGEIQKDIEEIQEDVDEIQEDVEHIEEEVKDISEEIDEDNEEDKKRDEDLLTKVEATLAQLVKEIDSLKKK